MDQIGKPPKQRQYNPESIKRSIKGFTCLEETLCLIPLLVMSILANN